MPVGPYGAITGADIINSNQGAIQTAAAQLRAKFASAPSWTYGAEGISQAQRDTGMNANLLRAGGAGIGQLLGFQPNAEGARAGDIVGAGMAAGGDLQGMQQQTEQYLKAPTYVAPPAPAAAPTKTRTQGPGRTEVDMSPTPGAEGREGPVEKPRRRYIPNKPGRDDEPVFTP